MYIQNSYNYISILNINSYETLKSNGLNNILVLKKCTLFSESHVSKLTKKCKHVDTLFTIIVSVYVKIGFPILGLAKF